MYCGDVCMMGDSCSECASSWCGHSMLCEAHGAVVASSSSSGAAAPTTASWDVASTPSPVAGDDFSSSSGAAGDHNMTHRSNGMYCGDVCMMGDSCSECASSWCGHSMLCEAHRSNGMYCG